MLKLYAFPLRLRAQTVLWFSFHFCLVFPTWAESTSNTAPSVSEAPASQSGQLGAGSDEAKNALRKAVAYQREARDLSLKFRASVYNSALDKQEEYDGRLWIKDAGKFKLEIPGAVYVSDGETYWEFHKSNHQVVLRKAKDLEDKPLPGDILLRFLDSEPMTLVKTKSDGHDYLEMRLDPTRAMKNLDSLVVLLDPANFSIHRITSRDVSGNEARYTVKALKRNGGIKDKEFVFVPASGTDIVDMRE